MKIAIIGGGNMGGAFARGIKRHFSEGDFELIVSEKNVEKHLSFHTLEIVTTTKNIDAVDNADVVILAVKPVDMESTCRDISVHLPAKCVVLSIAAGVRVASLASWLACPRVVRVMPNLLADIGKSMTVWFTDMQDETTKKLVGKILGSIGSAHQVASENEIDMATAISGCGPAYVWYFMEKMILAGVNIGLDPAVSKMLTIQTFAGASALATDVSPSSAADHGEFDPTAMRLKVASKGGSTERAIAVFDQRNLNAIIDEALLAAYRRAAEQGG